MSSQASSSSSSSSGSSSGSSGSSGASSSGSSGSSSSGTSRCSSSSLDSLHPPAGSPPHTTPTTTTSATSNHPRPRPACQHDEQIQFYAPAGADIRVFKVGRDSQVHDLLYLMSPKNKSMVPCEQKNRHQGYFFPRIVHDEISEFVRECRRPTCRYDHLQRIAIAVREKLDGISCASSPSTQTVTTSSSPAVTPSLKQHPRDPHAYPTAGCPFCFLRANLRNLSTRIALKFEYIGKRVHVSHPDHSVSSLLMLLGGEQHQTEDGGFYYTFERHFHLLGSFFSSFDKLPKEDGKPSVSCCIGWLVLTLRHALACGYDEDKAGAFYAEAYAIIDRARQITSTGYTKRDWDSMKDSIAKQRKETFDPLITYEEYHDLIQKNAKLERQIAVLQKQKGKDE